jgi:hypothetical protein
MGQKFADDYVTVAERIGAFYDRYPDGSLQSTILELSEDRVTIRAEAFRTPEDARPGIGHASMAIPGTTAFTRGSELENTESSAWGRALAALGFETKRGIASADEVRAKGGVIPERPAPTAAPRRTEPAAPEERPMPGNLPVVREAIPPTLSLAEALDILRRYAIDMKTISAKGRELYRQWQLKELTPEQRSHVVEELILDRLKLEGVPVLDQPDGEAAAFDEGDL